MDLSVCVMSCCDWPIVLVVMGLRVGARNDDTFFAPALTCWEDNGHFCVMGLIVFVMVCCDWPIFLVVMGLRVGARNDDTFLAPTMIMDWVCSHWFVATILRLCKKKALSCQPLPSLRAWPAIPLSERRMSDLLRRQGFFFLLRLNPSSWNEIAGRSPQWRYFFGPCNDYGLGVFTLICCD